MDLRSSPLFWSHRTPPLNVPQPLRADARCDVLVVGSGITGAFTAFEVARTGAEVIIVDCRPRASGSTPASTALVQYELDTSLLELGEVLGRDHAARAYRVTRRALEDIARVIHDLAANCDLVARPSLYLAVRPGDAE